MLTKNDVLESILKECQIAKHLYTKVPAGGLEYKPAPEMRSTLELLRYLSYAGIGGVCAVVDGGWDGYKEWSLKHKDISADEFPAAMDRQVAAIKDKFKNISEQDFANKEVTSPMGDKLKLGRGLLEMPLKWMVGYRMQLFLYAKAAGNHEIWTPDCWAGVSMAKTPPAKS